MLLQGSIHPQILLPVMVIKSLRFFGIFFFCISGITLALLYLCMQRCMLNILITSNLGYYGWVVILGVDYCWPICNAKQMSLSCLGGGGGWGGAFTAIPWDESMWYEYFSLAYSSMSWKCNWPVCAHLTSEQSQLTVAKSTAAFARQDFTSDDGMGGHHCSVPRASSQLQKQADSKVW